MGNSAAKEIEKHKKKEVVDLRKKGITELPPAIGVLKCKELILAENDITTIPDEIGKLPNITHLDVSNNRLTGLPPDIGQLKTLKVSFCIYLISGLLRLYYLPHLQLRRQMVTSRSFFRSTVSLQRACD